MTSTLTRGELRMLTKVMDKTRRWLTGRRVLGVVGLRGDVGRWIFFFGCFKGEVGGRERERNLGLVFFRKITNKS